MFCINSLRTLCENYANACARCTMLNIHYKVSSSKAAIYQYIQRNSQMVSPVWHNAAPTATNVDEDVIVAATTAAAATAAYGKPYPFGTVSNAQIYTRKTGFNRTIGLQASAGRCYIKLCA
ncbi:uncharacterized protein LOC110118728 isoform X2 [Ceratitis capitata]|uniref:uncharacterized protein LOC110118728 isoform X2 n=1 Tax=Ceratitis capitata TaxID=7213 RepID=UPI000A12294D|nr:uncharacterized protein LOC110118728 isoform X2 [Ceratitis capitata]XP_020716859.1 uncharacterized protein LOC110118728 isoform X2 [Ceratitis capitata]